MKLPAVCMFTEIVVAGVLEKAGALLAKITVN